MAWDGLRGRRSIRIPGSDYSANGAYFITVCTHRRRLVLDPPGLRAIVQSTWERLPSQFAGWVDTDEFVVMPNHVHGIVAILPTDTVATAEDEDGSAVRLRAGNGYGRATGPGAPSAACECGTEGPPTLGRIVQWLKGRITQEARSSGFPDLRWQRNCWEHVIRTEGAFHTIRWYIRDNPDRLGP